MITTTKALLSVRCSRWPRSAVDDSPSFFAFDVNTVTQNVCPARYTMMGEKQHGVRAFVKDGCVPVCRCSTKGSDKLFTALWEGNSPVRICRWHRMPRDLASHPRVAVYAADLLPLARASGVSRTNS